MGQALGGAAGGMLGGIEAGTRQQLGQQQIASESLKNAMALDQYRRQAAALQQPMPSLSDIRSGQGLLNWTKIFDEARQATQPSNAPQLPGSGVTQLPADQLSTVPKSRFAPANTQYTPPPPGAGGAVRLAANRFAQQYGIDADYFTTQIYAESHFDPNAVGPNTSGEEDRPIGVGQIKPSTAKGLGITNLRDPNENLDGSARYNLQLLKKNNGDYIKTAQDYGTIPRDLSKMDANQAMVYAAAQQANQRAGTAGGGMSSGSSPLASMSEMTPAEALRQQALLSAYGFKLPEVVNDWLMAQTMPAGPGRELAIAAAKQKAGLGPLVTRPGGIVSDYDPATGQRRPTFINPNFPQGFVPQYNEKGQLVGAALPPEIPRGEANIEAAKATGGEIGRFPFFEPKQRIKAQFEPPVEGYDEWSNPVQVPRTAINEFFGRQTQRSSATPPVRPPVVGGGMATGVPGAGSPSLAAPLVGGGLSTGMPGATGTPAAAPPAQSPEAAPASFTVNTPSGQKPITDVSIDDMFPGGAGIPVPRTAGPPTTLQKEVQKDDADRLESYNKEQASNQQINADLLRLRGVLNRGFTTGSAARLGSELANLAHSLGADWAYPKSWAPANAAEFDKASTDLVFAALKKLPGQPRVTEITGLQKANPALTLPRETNYQMMNDILAASKWQDERARLATEFTITHKGVPLSVFDTAYNRMAPLPDVATEYMNVMRQNGAVFPEDVKAGGGPGSSVAPASSQTRTIGGTTYHKIGDKWYPEAK
jgi:soluble lytic murein transglycosylase-like protein